MLVVLLYIIILIIAFVIGGLIIESISKAARGSSNKGEPFWGTTSSYVLSIIVGLAILGLLLRGCDKVFF